MSRGTKKRSFLLVLASTLVATLFVAAVAGAHPAQHGQPTGHLIGSGASGELEFVSKLQLTDEPEQVADVAVDPKGEYAYLAHWGEEDCAANSESGGTNDPDAGAWVVDIRDPENPKKVTFIPHSQDSRPGEGMQVVHVTTESFNGNMLAMNNEQCGKNGKGGISLYNVSNPAKPTKLSEHFGDRGFADTNDIHSAFVWDAGAKAYAVMTDNFEATDVDILDITNPKRPRLASEMDVNALTRALGDRVSQSDIGLGDSSLHDMIVKRVARSSVGLSGGGSVWVLLLSYWDGGYVLFNVDNPANPVYIDDTDYNQFDPELRESTGKELYPEGNGHQAEFTADDRFFIGTDEDFSPYGAQFQITSGPNAGTYPAGHFGWTKVIPPGTEITGQTVFGGFGCPDDRASIPSSAATGKDIIVFERGPVGHPTEGSNACFFSEKVESAQIAGYDLVLIANHHSGADGGFEGDAQFCGGQGHQFVNTIPAVCIGHRAMHLLFNEDVSYNYSAGSEPEVGQIGESIKISTTFDGWGYVHLFDSKTRESIDTYAIPEAHNESFAQGFGDLTVHEVATDPVDSSRAYLSYYSGGMRVLDVGAGGLTEVGGYLDPNGNNFWGVEAYRRSGDEHTYVLGSDRDYGLFVFRNHKGGH